MELKKEIVGGLGRNLIGAAEGRYSFTSHRILELEGTTWGTSAKKQQNQSVVRFL